jgi:hypothetical protein
LNLISNEKHFKKRNKKKCQDEAKEEKLKQRQSHAQTVLDFNSQSVVFTVSYAKATMLSVSVLELQFTWLLSWNI